MSLALQLCNNLVLGVSMAAVAEGLALGERLGLDPKLLSDIFNNSSARCWSSDSNNPCPVGTLKPVSHQRETWAFLMPAPLENCCSALTSYCHVCCAVGNFLHGGWRFGTMAWVRLSGEC